MKIRTDFVTNSSSSSYCVSIGITPTDDESFELDLSPKNNFDGDTRIYLNCPNSDFFKQIEQCRTIGEIKELVKDLLDFTEMYDDFCADNGIKTSRELLDVFKHAQEDESAAVALNESLKNCFLGMVNSGYEKEIVSEFDEFEKALDALKMIEKIKGVTLSEYRYADGEYTGTTLDSFLETVLPKELYETAMSYPMDDASLDMVRDCLASVLDNDAVESLISYIQDCTLFGFTATTKTSFDLKTKHINKQYSFEEFF